MLTRCSHGVVGAKPLVSRRCPHRVEVPSCTGKAQEPPGCCSAPQGAALVALGGPERPRGRQARAAKGGPGPEIRRGGREPPASAGKCPRGQCRGTSEELEGREGGRGSCSAPVSVWLYLSFPVPGQAAEHRLPKPSQTLPVSAPEPPEKAEAVTGGNRSSSGSVSPGKLKASVACREARLSLLSGRRRKG